jgi:DNA-binding CsgD family transcriptional regulator
MFYADNNIKYIFNFILALSLPYAVILIFSAYGPALHNICGPERNILFSSIFLIFLLSSMLIPVKKLHTIAFFRNLYYFSIAITAVLLTVFTIIPYSFKIAVLVLLGFVEGRIAADWSRQFLKLHNGRKKIFIISASLFLSYLLLYLANAVFPVLSVKVIPLICSVLLSASIPFLIFLSKLRDFKNEKLNDNTWPVSIDISGRSRRNMLLLIFIIYLTAGFTYTIIFPDLRDYGVIDRFYNVLPFVIIIPAAGVTALQAGLKHLPGIGIALLGISYILYLLPAGASTYFLVESFIQPGWAFLNLFVWTTGAYISQKSRQSRYLPVFISTFLGGTVTGAVPSSMVFKTDFYVDTPVIVLTLSVLPLFLVVPLLGRSLFAYRIANKNDLSSIPQDLLTEREYQIAGLILQGYSQKEICSGINISINTLKTHRRNIYRKLNVKNKSELRRFR